jgi:chromosome segregation ATPase
VLTIVTETLKNSLAQKVQDIQLLKQQRLSLARDLDKRILEQAKAALAHKEAVADIRAAYQAVLEAQIRLIEAKSDYESLQAEHSEMKEQLGKLEAEVSAMNRTKDAARAVAVKCKDRVALLTDQGVWNEGISEEMEGKSSESVKADIRTQETRLGVIEALNPHALVEYERRAEQIDKLKRERAAREDEAGTLTAEIKEIRDKFEPGLDDIVGRISQAFSHNFERINCAGEVDVYKDEEDFARWAIEIKVRFREGETLQILDQHRQSGGERAVSTIFYLMSLQAMAQAPFRVVDEINQGMDPRNERKVHERMVDIACREHTSQYFLITPKLLTDLAYDKRMTVHVIASGEHVPSYDDRKKEGVDVLDFKKCVQIKRELAARMAYPSPEPVR